jgi:hypothetical protein
MLDAWEVAEPFQGLRLSGQLGQSNQRSFSSDNDQPGTGVATRMPQARENFRHLNGNLTMPPQHSARDNPSRRSSPPTFVVVPRKADRSVDNQHVGAVNTMGHLDDAGKTCPSHPTQTRGPARGIHARRARRQQSADPRVIQEPKVVARRSCWDSNESSSRAQRQQ